MARKSLQHYWVWCHVMVGILLILVIGTPSSGASSIDAAVVDEKGMSVANAVVTAYPVNRSIPPPAAQTYTVDQVDKEFIPEVSVFPVNSRVLFPNSDRIRHHVYSLSTAKMFDLPLYLGTPSNPVIFDKPGVVALGCNIHDWMIAYVYVTDTPYYAITDAGGKARIEGLVDGRYNIVVWHPRKKDGKEDAGPSTVTAGETGIRYTIKLKPPMHIRRSPVVRGEGY